MSEIKKTAIIGMGALGLLYGNKIKEEKGNDAVSFIVDEDRYLHYKDRHFSICNENKSFNIEPEVPSFYTKDYVGAGISISS